MSYGLICTKHEIEILENNNIDFIYWDLLSKDNNRYEIDIENWQEFEKVCKLLNKNC